MPANEFYDSTGTPSSNTLASSSSMRAEFDLVEAGFNKLPTMAANGDEVVVVNAGGTALTTSPIATVAATVLALKADLTSPVLVTPNLGTPSAGVVTNLTGTAAGVSIGGNAATATLASTVTTNANLTGVVTSTGNATAIADAALSIAKTSGLQTALDAKASKLSWSIKTTTYTAAAGDAIMANTTSAAFTITLPASPSANDVVDIADYAGTFGTNNLTIGRNALKIMGLSEDMTVSVSNVKFRLVYIDATVGWRLV